MKLLLLLLVVTTVCISVVHPYHMVVGNVSNRVRVANQTLVEYMAFPFVKRVKYFFITLPDNNKIQGIQALDNLQSKSSINITAGGVGYSYANLRMKSERGRGLSYNIGVYVSEDYV